MSTNKNFIVSLLSGAKRNWFLVTLVCALLTVVTMLSAQPGPPTPGNRNVVQSSTDTTHQRSTTVNNPSPPGKSDGSQIPTPLGNATTLEPSTKQFLLPLMVLGFGVIIMFLVLVIKRAKTNQITDNDLRLESITLITIGVLFMIATGNSGSLTQNVTPLYAPAFGLLGTMAGYLFGRASSGDKGSTGGDSSTGVGDSKRSQTP